VAVLTRFSVLGDENTHYRFSSFVLLHSCSRQRLPLYEN
jgi:hypothetical protein